jgi:hypothetical protein
VHARTIRSACPAARASRPAPGPFARSSGAPRPRARQGHDAFIPVERRPGQQRPQYVRLEGSCEKIALPKAATELAERPELIASLDAFGHDLQVERLTELDDRLDEHRALTTATETVDEGSVDLRASTGNRSR